ncbi:hypothetical protein ESCO_004617 [Escovopsis weberi]|uniref:Uncharacterized protein n=1 Tax=Escovopsis weberi TaxID=150374 RepID=A0A0M8MZL9_ESCWE|nr:hypothetical protein ESCO_004617 [Escovopsis weberi]
MNPEAKFSSPNPVPPAPSRPEHTRRAASASSLLRSRSPSRPASPAPSWRRLFERKRGRSSENVPQKRQFLNSYDSDDNAVVLPTRENDSASTSTTTLVSARGPPAREISPEALHRFLREDTGSRSGSGATERPTLKIPDAIDDIDADESDDEDNFAVSAVSESQSYLTRLSPPPFQRSASSDSISPTTTLSPVQRPAKTTNFMTKLGPRWSISLASGSSPTSEEELLPLYELNDVNDSEDNDDNDEHNGLAPCLDSPVSLRRQDTFRGYSLPRIGEETQKMPSPGQSFAGFESPDMIARTGSEMSNGSNFLGGHIDTGLDDFVSEMGWIVDVIGTISDN